MNVVHTMWCILKINTLPDNVHTVSCNVYFDTTMFTFLFMSLYIQVSSVPLLTTFSDISASSAASISSVIFSAMIVGAL